MDDTDRRSTQEIIDECRIPNTNYVQKAVAADEASDEIERLREDIVQLLKLTMAIEDLISDWREKTGSASRI